MEYVIKFINGVVKGIWLENFWKRIEFKFRRVFVVYESLGFILISCFLYK